MALRFRTREEHVHSGRRIAYLAVACAAAAVLFPAAGNARSAETASAGSAQILVTAPLQINASGRSFGKPALWSYRPFTARRSDALITVNTTSDAPTGPSECLSLPGDCSLRQAIDKASTDGGDDIDLPAGTYTVTLGTLLINKSVTLVGADPATTIIDGSGNFDPNDHQLSRIMKIGSGQVSLVDLSMTGGVDDNDENGSSGATVNLHGGGAIFNDGGSLTLANVVFSNNASNNPIGGAIANDGGGTLGMSDVTFADDGAAVGGSLRIRSGTVDGIGVTFTNSYGEFGGGGVYIDGGLLTLTNSTIDGSAGLDGFGIGIQNAGGRVTLLNVTIAHSQGYALMTDVGATTTIENTIVGAGGRGDCDPANRADSVTDATTAAAVTGNGNNNNLDQNGDCNISGSNNLTGDPLLTAPGDFGGPTQTDALLAGSPAIGAGSSCPPIDQRGVTRSNPCDIGAFESIGGAQASFTYDPPTPLDGQTVTFTNTSSTTNDASLTYLWDFGDGMTSTDVSPTHVFPAPDQPLSYKVTLQATDSSGSVDETFQIVTVHPANEQPIAAFTFGSAAPGTPVQFDGSGSNDPDGQIVSYDWSWGDDSEDSSGVNPTHTFASAGNYPVTLTVTDNGGRTDSISQNVTVATPDVSDYYVDASWADHSNGDTVTGPEGQPLTFGTDAFATIHDALGAANDGDPNTTVHVAAGSYTEEEPLSMTQEGLQLVGVAGFGTQVHLTELDVDGTDEVVRQLDLIGPGHDGGEGTGCQGCGTSPVVSLGGDENSDEDDVSQDALITGNQIHGGFIGIAFTSGNGDNFPTSGSEALNNEIFGNVTGVSVDGGSGNLIESNSIHDNGTTSQSGNGQPQAGVLITDESNNQPTGNVIVGNTISGSTGNGVSLRTSGNSVVDNTIANSGAGYTVHPTEASGIELVAGSDDNVDDNSVNGNTISGSAFAGIKIGDSTDGNTISGNTITDTQHGGANGNSGATPGGGGTAILLTGFGATNTTISDNTLGPNSGYGILQENSDASEGDSTGTDVHQNSISGNTRGGILNEDPASIDATQNWWGSASGPPTAGPDSVSTNVTFVPLLACPPDTSPCANEPPQASVADAPATTPGSLQVAFDASSSADPDGTIASYAWDFGDGSTATGATPSHTYAAAGTYTVALTVTDNQGATNTTTRQVTVPAVAASQPSAPAANQPPHASFVLTPPGTAGSLQITVDGSGSSDPDGTIASYAWNFGDGTTATGASTTHTYAAAGTFTITLTVTDNQGATSTASQQVTVPVPGAPAPPLPPPVKGVSVDILPFIGTVLVNGLPLVAGQQIPFGAIVDTTNGTVLLEDIGPGGQLEAAYFAGAIFKLVKTPAGLTELLLQGGNFNVCSVKSKRHSAAAGAKPPKKQTTVVRSLWGNGHGQFVTQGKYAAATVRGTIWNTQDRCDGTFVQVQRGIVSVQDLVRHKTKSVTAGHSLLVPAP